MVAHVGSTVSFILPVFNKEKGNDIFKYILVKLSIPVGIRRLDWRDPKALICCTVFLLVQMVHNQAKAKK